MKVIQVVSSIDVSTGGPARSITTAAQGVINHSEHEIKLYTGNSKNPEFGELKAPEKVIEFFEVNKIGRFKALNSLYGFDPSTIFHIHGLWQMSSNQFVRKAQRLNLPYIISPHGMLEPWALNQSYLKKKFALLLYQYSDLKNAKCIHATSVMEANSIRNMGFKNPIAIIPNGVFVSDNFIFNKSHVRNKKVLFISRIYPGKGIENLIDAWFLIPNQIKSDWTLDIVGNGDCEYVDSLNNRITSKQLNDSIQILGPIYDSRKEQMILDSDVFVLPTFSENFGMVVAEAMSFGLPVITTKGAPWEELETHNAGWWIDIGVEPLVRALSEAMTTPKEKLVEMGLNGRKIIEEKYSVEKVSKQMIELYEWILKKGPKPEFVYN